MGIVSENMTPSTELPRDFCAGIGPLQLGVVLVQSLFSVIIKDIEVYHHMFPMLAPHCQCCNTSCCSLSSAITNPKPGPKEAQTKSYNFDYSYWSHTTVSLMLLLHVSFLYESVSCNLNNVKSCSLKTKC